MFQMAIVNVLKLQTLLFLLKQMFVIRTGTHKMLVRIANTEDPDRTAS